MIKNLLIFLLAFLIIIVYINREKFTNRELLETIKYDTIYTTKQSIKYKKGNDIPFYIIDSVRTEVHDTIRIINDYNRIYAYNDTILMDSNSFYIQDTITQNKIIGRKFEANIKEKAIYITKTIQPKKELLIGGEIRSFNNVLGASIGLGLKVPNKGLILINYGTQGYSLGFYKKL